jgi:hypothetical protein
LSPYTGTFWKLHNMACTEVVKLMEAKGDFQTKKRSAEQKVRSFVDMLGLQCRVVTNTELYNKEQF